jgi:hypothetical protein
MISSTVVFQEIIKKEVILTDHEKIEEKFNAKQENFVYVQQHLTKH